MTHSNQRNIGQNYCCHPTNRTNLQAFLVRQNELKLTYSNVGIQKFSGAET